MNVTCQNCKTKLNIPDDKIPKNKESIFKCPKCKEKVSVSAPDMEQNNFAEENKSQSQPRSFEDRRNALVCIGDDDLKQKIYSTIDQMGFSADTVNNTKAALKKMDYHIYHLVIMDETFDKNKGITGLIDTINSIDMYLRRRMCLVLVSDQFKTNDDMAALHASVNKVIQLDDINHLDTFLSKALVEHKNFYTVYNESLKLAGRA
jgi:predicted Zn finger-like uncharacterized protein